MFKMLTYVESCEDGLIGTQSISTCLLSSDGRYCSGFMVMGSYEYQDRQLIARTSSCHLAGKSSGGEIWGKGHSKFPTWFPLNCSVSGRGRVFSTEGVGSPIPKLCGLPMSFERPWPSAWRLCSYAGASCYSPCYGFS